MKHYILAAALLLSSCRSSEPLVEASHHQSTPVADNKKAAPLQAVEKGLEGTENGVISSSEQKNSASASPPKRRLLGILPPKKPKPASQTGIRKCKDCTFVQGNDNQVQQTGKKSQAPVGQAAPGADLNQASSKTGVAQAGEGNHAKQEQAAVKPWYGFLLGPVGIVLGLAVAAALVYGVVQYRRARSVV